MKTTYRFRGRQGFSTDPLTGDVSRGKQNYSPSLGRPLSRTPSPMLGTYQFCPYRPYRANAFQLGISGAAPRNTAFRVVYLASYRTPGLNIPDPLHRNRILIWLRQLCPPAQLTVDDGGWVHPSPGFCEPSEITVFKTAWIYPSCSTLKHRSSIGKPIRVTTKSTIKIPARVGTVRQQTACRCICEATHGKRTYGLQLDDDAYTGGGGGITRRGGSDEPRIFLCGARNPSPEQVTQIVLRPAPSGILHG